MTVAAAPRLRPAAPARAPRAAPAGPQRRLPGRRGLRGPAASVWPPPSGLRLLPTACPAGGPTPEGCHHHRAQSLSHCHRSVCCSSGRCSADVAAASSPCCRCRPHQPPTGTPCCSISPASMISHRLRSLPPPSATEARALESPGPPPQCCSPCSLVLVGHTAPTSEAPYQHASLVADPTAGCAADSPATVS